MRLYQVDSFDDDVQKLNPEQQRQVEKIKEQIIRNPHIGRPLRYNFLREKRMREKRIYFLIYEDIDVVLLLGITGKKAQTDYIDRIVELLPEYKEIIESIN